MTEKGSLRDTEMLVCILLCERAPLTLRDLGRCIGHLKEAFRAERESGTIHEALRSLDGCVDDVPKAVRLLQERGVIERLGKTPREWAYKLRADFQATEHLPVPALESLRFYIAKLISR